MIEIVIWVIGWVICGILAYVLDRKLIRSHLSWTWTKGDRNFHLMGSILGPMALLVSIIVYLCLRDNNNEPSSW